MDSRPIRHILCSIDFSDFSRHALDHSIAIAHSCRARVTALHVFVSPVEGALFAGSGDFRTVPLSIDHREALTAHLKRFASTAGDASPLDCVVRESPDVAARILHEAETTSPDLLVIGTHGRSGFDRLLLGSVTEKILRKAPCPVLTIPPRTPEWVPVGPAPYKRILCGTDFSDCSRAALSHAVTFARLGAEWLGVVHAIDLPPAFATTSLNPHLSTLESILRTDTEKRFAELLPDLDVGATCKVESIVATGRPYRALLELGAARSADLIVLGVHGRGAIDRMFFGSTTTHVVRTAACPVLTVRV